MADYGGIGGYSFLKMEGLLILTDNNYLSEALLLIFKSYCYISTSIYIEPITYALETLLDDIKEIGYITYLSLHLFNLTLIHLYIAYLLPATICLKLFV